MAKQLSSELQKAVQTSFNLGAIFDSEQILVGEWNEIWRMNCDAGPFILRKSNSNSTEETVNYEHQFTSFLSSRLSFVPSPRTTSIGAYTFTHEEQVISVFPFIEGVMTERSNEIDRDNAARSLAKIHLAGLDYPDMPPRPVYPSLSELDWDNNPMWNWNMIEQFISESPPKHTGVINENETDSEACIQEIFLRKSQISDERLFFKKYINDISHLHPQLKIGMVHGDYYPRNILTSYDSITGVTDWDECKPDWLSWELGRSIWEFCEEYDEHELNHAKAIKFRDIYLEAGGPVPASEFEYLIPFIRCVRINEVLWDLDRASKGLTWSPEYTRHNLISLENLKTAKPLV